MKLLALILISLATNTLADQWIDPHDMNTNAKDKYMRPTLKKSSGAACTNEGNGNILPDICFSHLKRLVGVLMTSGYIDKRNPELYHGHIRFSIDPTNFDFLVNFMKDDVSLEKLRKLDAILSENFRRNSFDENLDIAESFIMRLNSLVINEQSLWLLAVVGLLYVAYQLVKNNFSLFYICKYFFIIILIVDGGMRYHYLREEAEEHNMSIVYSEKCDPHKMSWAEWTKHFFSPNTCEKKVVTPLDAVMYQIKNLIIIPMDAFGTGMGSFGKNMFTNLPWGLNLIMWPLMLIFTLILLPFLMTIFSGQPIEFNLFHLFKLRFGGESRRENVLTGPTVERLMDRFLHRQMVQNISLPANNENPGSPHIDSKNSSGDLTGKEPVSDDSSKNHEAKKKYKLHKKSNAKCNREGWIKNELIKGRKEENYEKLDADKGDVKEIIESVSSVENSRS